MSTKKRYLVLSPVLIAGEITKDGTVECTPEEAAPLLKTGSLQEAPVKSEKKENVPTEAASEVPAETPAEIPPAAINAEQKTEPAKKGGKKAGTK